MCFYEVDKFGLYILKPEDPKTSYCMSLRDLVASMRGAKEELTLFMFTGNLGRVHEKGFIHGYAAKNSFISQAGSKNNICR